MRHYLEDRFELRSPELTTEEFLEQMSEDEDLAIFMMDVETLKEALSGFTTIFLTDESAPWHLLNESQEAGAGAIPQPANEAEPGATARRGS